MWKTQTDAIPISIVFCLRWVGCKDIQGNWNEIQGT